jgi:hypothetical protein
VVRPDEPEVLVLLVAAIFSAAGVGYGIYQMIWPLIDREFQDQPELFAGRTRVALEREKTLVLRSLKELEFDQAMGKVSDRDFRQMSEKLRARAIALIKQLDIETPNVRVQIERELAERLKATDIEFSEPAVDTRSACSSCGASNEHDAKFCKSCGHAFNSGISPEDIA